MGTYYVGEGDQHRVDHPPIFACREHKALLKFNSRFVAELLASAEDIMPGNPDEIASSYLKEAEASFTLPPFLIPPKIVLFNPRGLRGAEALPYTLVLVDKKFFGIPARYLTPDRFDGCDACRKAKPRPRPQPRPARGAPGVSRRGDSGVRRAPGRGPARNDESGGHKRPPGRGPQRGAARKRH